MEPGVSGLPLIEELALGSGSPHSHTHTHTHTRRRLPGWKSSARPTEPRLNLDSGPIWVTGWSLVLGYSDETPELTAAESTGMRL